MQMIGSRESNAIYAKNKLTAGIGGTDESPARGHDASRHIAPDASARGEVDLRAKQRFTRVPGRSYFRNDPK